MADENVSIDQAPVAEPAVSSGFTFAAPSKLPKGWSKDSETGVGFVAATGLTPVMMLVSEAGFGLRNGEVRGVPPNVAVAMVAKKSARLVFPA